MSSSHIQENYKTHNGTWKKERTSYGCRPSRPCYREQQCKYCINRRIRFICDQVEPHVGPNSICQFVTVSLPRTYDAHQGMMDIRHLRRHLHFILRENGHYITVAALGTQDGLSFTPHVHSLSGKVSEGELKRKLGKRAALAKERVQIEVFQRDLLRRAKRAVGYMVKQNYRPTLPLKPKGMRLITSSRGLCVSRPTRIKHQWPLISLAY